MAGIKNDVTKSMKRKSISKNSSPKDQKRTKTNHVLAEVLKGTVFENCDPDLILNPNKCIEDEIKNLKVIHNEESVKKKYKEIQSDIQKIIASQFENVKVELFGLRASGLGALDGRLEVFVQSTSLSQKITGDVFTTAEYIKNWDVLKVDECAVFCRHKNTNIECIIYNGDCSLGRWCYINWKVIEAYFKLQPEFYKMYLFFKCLFQESSQRSQLFKYIDHLIINMIMFYFQYYFLDRYQGFQKKYLLSIEKYLKSSWLDKQVEHYVRMERNSVDFDDLLDTIEDAELLEIENFKIFLKDILEFWIKRKSFNLYIYNVYHGIWNSERQRTDKKVTVLRENMDNTLTTLVESDEIENLLIFFKDLTKLIKYVPLT